MWTAFLKNLDQVKTPWTMAAFAIAAVLALSACYGTRRGSGARNGLFVGTLAILMLAFAPMAVSVFSSSRDAQSIYRLRVITVDAQNAPIADASVRSTALAETMTTADGTAEFTMPASTLPASRGIVIFGQKPSAFLHGSVAVTLGDDHNPVTTLVLRPDSDSNVVRGSVQDGGTGHTLAGAVVSVPGFQESATTGDNGSFEVNAHAASGQTVRLHVEKPGYDPLDQDHIVGSLPAVIQLVANKRH